jgi:hypothetical protein
MTSALVLTSCPHHVTKERVAIYRSHAPSKWVKRLALSLWGSKPATRGNLVAAAVQRPAAIRLTDAQILAPRAPSRAAAPEPQSDPSGASGSAADSATELRAPLGVASAAPVPAAAAVANATSAAVVGVPVASASGAVVAAPVPAAAAVASALMARGLDGAGSAPITSAGDGPIAPDPDFVAEQQAPGKPSDGLAHLPPRDPPPTEEPLVYSIGRETWIFAEPRFDAVRLGYLRFGAEVRRTTAAVSRRGCSGGWYGVQPSGYVCVNGRTATADPAHPLAQVRVERPDRMAALPYAYTMARRGVPRFFGRLPNDEERPNRSFSKRLLTSLGNPRTSAAPAWLRVSRQVFGYQRPKDSAAIGDGLVGAGIALLGFYTDAGTLYGITPDLELVTTDALEAAKPSAFAGRPLSPDDALPVAFAMSGSVWLYTGDPRTGTAHRTRQLGRREAVSVLGARITEHGQQWLQTRDGSWLQSTGLRVIEARTEWPEWASRGQAWVDVSISQQSLVAYDGTAAAYVTLVSTGVDGLSDPATTKSTKTGVFRIVSKHLTATMNGEEPDHAYEMREVPWVQYFSEGYALHGVYWHDGFGQPRSHGCVNLSPIDARWLFHFTNPGLPKNWHGAIPAEKSAIVFVHP